MVIQAGTVNHNILPFLKNLYSKKRKPKNTIKIVSSRARIRSPPSTPNTESPERFLLLSTGSVLANLQIERINPVRRHSVKDVSSPLNTAYRLYGLKNQKKSMNERMYAFSVNLLNSRTSNPPVITENNKLKTKLAYIGLISDTPPTENSLKRGTIKIIQSG